MYIDILYVCLSLSVALNSEPISTKFWLRDSLFIQEWRSTNSFTLSYQKKKQKPSRERAVIFLTNANVLFEGACSSLYSSEKKLWECCLVAFKHSWIKSFFPHYIAELSSLFTSLYFFTNTFCKICHRRKYWKNCLNNL